MGEGDFDMPGLQQTKTIQDVHNRIQLPNVNIPKTESIGGGFIQSTEGTRVKAMFIQDLVESERNSERNNLTDAYKR